jgi:PiT family inorganic phosphate transporter
VVSLAHDTNDAQKTMGIVTLALIIDGHLHTEPVARRCGSSTCAVPRLPWGTYLGVPRSTRQITTGSVIGFGLGKRAAQVRWGVAGRMAEASLLTIPATALAAALIGVITHPGNTIGIVAVGVLAASASLGAWLHPHRDPVNVGKVNEHAGRTDRQLTGSAA